MSNSRRDLIQLAGLAGIAGLAAGPTTAATSSTAMPSAATSTGANTANGAFPRGVTYATIVRDGEATLAMRTARGVLDVAALERERSLGLPRTIHDVLQRRGNLAALASVAGDPATPDRYILSETAAPFGPCVTNPDKIICMGRNYRAHAAETGNEVPTTPILFNKFRTSLNSHRGTIRISTEPAKNWDYEAELVIVMGRGGRNIPEATALDWVFGYCVGQDFTARDLQRLTVQWMLGKAGDGWGPIGPWLVSADQVDPDNLDIQCALNGEIRQKSNTRMMVFNCRQMISYISRHMTLSPGDIIFTGTPEGVIDGYPADKKVWMKPGDRLVTTIEKLGEQQISLT